MVLDTPLFNIQYYKVFSIQLIGLVGSLFANRPGDLGSIPGRVIPKTLKMVLDTSLLNTQQYKVSIKDKVEQSREKSSTLPQTSVLWLLKREPSDRPRLRSPTLLTTCYKVRINGKVEQFKERSSALPYTLV